MQEIFQRIEEKYILTRAQKERFVRLTKEYLKDDEYGPSTICNIYFDNENNVLIDNMTLNFKSGSSSKIILKYSNLSTSFNSTLLFFICQA